MAADGRDAILFLDKNRLFIYDGSKVLTLDIPNTLIRDADVIDKSGLDTLVNEFIKTHNLEEGKLWIVLSEGISFSKDFSQTDPVKLEEEAKEFLEAVPFDQLISKRYKSQSGVRVIATNWELVESLAEIFERNSFGFEGIVPCAIFAGFNTRKTLDLDYVKFILANKNLMKAANMLQKVNAAAPPNPETPAPKKKSTLLPYLLIGFGVLLAILVVVLVMRFK